MHNRQFSARRAGSQVVTNVVCDRFHPDPLGIVLWYSKLEFAEGSARPNNTVIPNQSADWCGNLHRISCSFSSYPVGALIERPAGKVSIFVFLSAKRCNLT